MTSGEMGQYSFSTVPFHPFLTLVIFIGVFYVSIKDQRNFPFRNNEVVLYCIVLYSEFETEIIWTCFPEISNFLVPGWLGTSRCRAKQLIYDSPISIRRRRRSGTFHLTMFNRIVFPYLFSSTLLIRALWDGLRSKGKRRARGWPSVMWTEHVVPRLALGFVLWFTTWISNWCGFIFSADYTPNWYTIIR